MPIKVVLPRILLSPFFFPETDNAYIKLVVWLQLTKHTYVNCYLISQSENFRYLFKSYLDSQTYIDYKNPIHLFVVQSPWMDQFTERQISINHIKLMKIIFVYIPSLWRHIFFLSLSLCLNYNSQIGAP